MGELTNILSFIKESGLELNAVSFAEIDKLDCYLFLHEINDTINPKARNITTKRQLVKVASGVISEGCSGIVRIFARRPELEVITGVTVLEAVKEITELPCDELEELMDIMENLARIFYVCFAHNREQEEITLLLIQVLMYICVAGINKLNVVDGREQLLEGVNVILYERKTKVYR